MLSDRVVSIVYSDNGHEHRCSGSRVRDKYVLTSPGCAAGTNQKVFVNDSAFEATTAGPGDFPLPGLLYALELPAVGPTPLAGLGNLGRHRLRGCTAWGFVRNDLLGSSSDNVVSSLIGVPGSIMEEGHDSRLILLDSIATELPVDELDGGPIVFGDGTIIGVLAKLATST